MQNPINYLHFNLGYAGANVYYAGSCNRNKNILNYSVETESHKIPMIIKILSILMQCDSSTLQTDNY